MARIPRSPLALIRLAFSLLSPDPGYTREFGVFRSMRTLGWWNGRFMLRDWLETTRTIRLSKGTVKLVAQNYRELDRLDRYTTKEPETIVWIESDIKPGDVFYDIGANIGQYSLYAAVATQRQARVYAFEPESCNYAKLNRNIHLNGLQEVIVPLNLAISDRQGIAELRVTAVRPGYAAHQLDVAQNRYRDEYGCCHRQGIVTTTLDALVADFGIRPPNHLKIDVDGVEDLILAGAKRVLQRIDLRSVLIEANERSRQFVIELMRENGFTLSLMADGANLIFRRRAGPTPRRAAGGE